MDDTTPERQGGPGPTLQRTPETPVLRQEVAEAARLLIPSSMFRPWDTPESLSPTSSNFCQSSLSPTSSSSLPSSPDSEDLAKSSPGSDISPASSSGQVYLGPDGQPLYKLEPLPEPGQGVDSFYNNFEKENSDFISGKDSRSRKRKRKERFQLSAASPVLAKKSRSAAKALVKGDFPPCGVCGEESTGVHYGAAVCEGCKGFFRRRVVYRDVSALVCGSGGQCDVSGKGRIHCKLCRYNRCVQIGMKPGAIKHEVKLSSNLTFEEQVLRCHKETLTPLPAIYLARQHTENIEQWVAGAWPVTADLGPLSSPAPGPADSARFVRSLPGWAELTSQDRQWAASTGTVQVMLVRLLARYRPEVGAFLFPCGQFVYPGQLRASLPEVTVAHLTSLAHSLASRGLTQQELSLVSSLLASNPLSASSLYKSTLAAISETSSGLHLTDLALQVSELAWTASPEQWTNISISA